MLKPQQTINLAKNRGETFWDSFISWALTAGRVVIIVTEGIALLAFLYRFSLDRQLVDLHDHIQQQTAIVNLLKNNETTFRSLQNRLTLAKQLITSTDTFTKTFIDILQLIPSDMNVTSFQITPTAVHIEGSLQSITSLRSLVDKLKSYPNVSSVSIDKIQTDTSNATLEVALTILLKNVDTLHQSLSSNGQRASIAQNTQQSL